MRRCKRLSNLFAVTFKQDLDVSVLDYVYKDVRQTCLHRWMQV